MFNNCIPSNIPFLSHLTIAQGLHFMKGCSILYSLIPFHSPQPNTTLGLRSLGWNGMGENEMKSVLSIGCN